MQILRRSKFRTLSSKSCQNRRLWHGTAIWHYFQFLQQYLQPRRKGSDTGLKAFLGKPNSLTSASSFALITSMNLRSLTLVIDCDHCKEKINNLTRKKA